MRVLPIFFLALCTFACGTADNRCTAGTAMACTCAENRPGQRTCNAAGALSSCACSKRVFTTQAVFTGQAIGNINSADDKCQAAATGAMLSGTFKAWISNASTDALSRVSGAGPWFLISGEKAFNDRAALASAPAVALSVGEDGKPVSGSAWTGTLTGGTRSDDHCTNWLLSSNAAAMAGDVASTAQWTQSVTQSCTNGNHLYCFEQ